MNNNKQKIMIIEEKTGTLTEKIGGKLREYGYDVEETKLDVMRISQTDDTVGAVLLYMESRTEGFEAELQCLRYTAEQNKIQVFCIGPDVPGLKMLLSEQIIAGIFTVPFDIDEAAREIGRHIIRKNIHIRHKILVVDDSGAVLRSVKEWLGKKYDVAIANSGAMAIKYLATNRPELILLDYEMPVVDGGTVFQMIRSEKEYSDIPIIFLTGKNDRDSIMKVMALKPDDYILKSIPHEQIENKIDDFFAKKDGVYGR